MDPLEPDTLSQSGTWRRYIQDATRGLRYIRDYWGRRIYGTLLGIVWDGLSEAGDQGLYARMPGHPQQAPDSLAQVGRDRDLIRFRGELAANWLARVRAAWDDYPQGGTPQQVLRIVNQWGNAGWPVTWDESLVTLVESGDPDDWWFEVTIPFGLINPPWPPEVYGSGFVYGSAGFYYGIGASNDLPMLLYVVRKWKRSASRGRVKIFYDVGLSVTFTV